MKDLIKAFILMCFFYGSAYAQTTGDPKKNVGPMDLKTNPEVMTSAVAAVKSGKINYLPKHNADTSLDLNKHPELVKAMIKDPAHWATILKVKNVTDTSQAGLNKQVIRDIIAVLVSKHVVKDKSEINSFLLTDQTFTLNGKIVSGSLQAELKQKYIKSADYMVYFGNSEKNGKGIFQRKDNL